MPSHRTRLIVKTAAATVGIGALAAVALGALVLKAGWYNVGATDQHFQFVYSLLEQGMRDSVSRRARDVKVPELASPQLIKRGAAIYRDNCAHCHGGPGLAQADWGKSMQPVPGSLVDSSREWKPGELYWVTKHGIKMSGMPAWEYHLADDELWAVVGFLQHLPSLTPQAYREITATQVAK